LGSLRLLVVLHPVDLEEESLGRGLDPAVLLDPDDLALVVAVVVDVGNGYLLAGVVQFSVLGVYEQQAEQLLLRLVDALFLVDEGVLDLPQKLLGDDGLLADPDAGMPEEGGLLSSERVYLGGAELELVLLVLLRFPLDLHLPLLASLLEPVFYPAQEHKVELPYVLLVPDRQLVAIVVDDGGDDGGRVHVLAVGGDEGAEEMLEMLH
jgi:hypothetical protein